MDYCSSSVWMTSTKRCPGLALLLARLRRSPKSTPPQEQESLRSGTQTVTTSWSVRSTNNGGWLIEYIDAAWNEFTVGCSGMAEKGDGRHQHYGRSKGP